MKTIKLDLSVSKLKFSTSPEHINKMLWEGSITAIDKPSDGPPGGSDGRRVIFTREAVEKKCHTFNQMPLNCTFPDGWFADGTEVFTGHGDLIIGYIESAWAEGNDLMAKGVIWKNNFPDIAFMTVNGKDSLGFSVELYVNESHNGEGDGYLYVDDFVGVGCAMLWQNTAAFGSSTYIRELVAKRERNDNLMNKEELKAMLDEFTGDMLVKFSQAVEDKANGIVAKFAADYTDKITQLTASMEEKDGILASKDEEIANLKAEVEAKEAIIEASKTQTPPARQTKTYPTQTKFEGQELEDKIKEIKATIKDPVKQRKAIYEVKYGL